MKLKVYLSGIAGTGMSALAGLFKEIGFDVYGSDENIYSPVKGILENLDINIFRQYHEKNIPPDVSFCVIGNIISRGNPEAEFILNNNIEYYSMAEALYKFVMKGKKSVVVAGTHGKTTTTSFVAYLLKYAGLKPGYFIGGKPVDFKSNFSLGGGEYFIVEGDEYETAFFDRSSKFLKYHPYYLILNSIEYDHIDFFPDEYAYLASFQNLVNQVPAKGLIIVNKDFKLNRKAIKNSFTEVVSYGTNDSDYLIKKIINRGNNYSFKLRNNLREVPFESSILGRYNIWNLSPGIILGSYFVISDKVIGEAVASFSGVERRLQVIRRIKNTVFFEDFAHHPTSIKKILTELKSLYSEERLICIFEPRSWSLRRNFFQSELAESFLEADTVVFKDVYKKDKIPEDQRLNILEIKKELIELNKQIFIYSGYDQIREFVLKIDFEDKNIVVLISNGDFGGIASFIRELK